MPCSELKLLIAEGNGFPAAAAEALRGVADVRLADLDRTGLLQAVSAAHVLWVRLRNRIDAEVLAAAPQLKIIVTPTTGLNHIDLVEAARRGIQVLSLRGETEFLKEVRATAEHTIGLILALLRNTVPAVASVITGAWNRDSFRGAELYGKTAGVVGYGRLGRIVARYLRAFEMQVLACDPHVNPASVESDVALVSLPKLLSKSDIVTLHVNLCAETIGFFGAPEFALMKNRAWFINTSRGELINEAALLATLQSGLLAGAALDVVSGENTAGMADHPLIQYARQHNNLLLTPHIGGLTSESAEKTELFLAEKLRQTLANLSGWDEQANGADRGCSQTQDKWAARQPSQSSSTQRNLHE